MATTTLGETIVNLSGEPPEVGSSAGDITLTTQGFEDVTLERWAGKKKVLNIFPSLDTGICATSVKTFHARAGELEDVVVLNVSADLPPAAKRFCTAEGVAVEFLSTFRSSFDDDWGLRMLDAKLAGLLARSVFVLDADNKIIHREIVPIAQEPNYDDALAALG